jgi:plasmid stabilization system protein ParE
MAPLPIELHPEAVAEARGAREWYEERSPVAAGAFMAELDLAIDRISSSPDRWATYLHGTRRYLLNRFPYFIVYRKTGDKLQVVAVAHGRRRPGYWRYRLKTDDKPRQDHGQ